MIVDILYLKYTDKVIVFPAKTDFVNGTTFPHYTNFDGVRYRLKKYKYNDNNFLVGTTEGVKQEDVDSAIEEFKPDPL